MSSYKRYILMAFVVLFASGCATITSGSNQSLTLSTTDQQGVKVEAECSLKNNKGSWTAASPGVVEVHRSSEDLMVECNKEGHETGLLRAISRAAAGMWGNIIFGGGIGALIDHGKGTGYNYPNDLPVIMGESVTVDRYNQGDEEEPASE